jgi:hypothetical protein
VAILFIVTLSERQNNNKLIRNSESCAVHFGKYAPTILITLMHIDAIAILPAHLYCIWQLPADDAHDND